ncbi:MAG: hypothetical protein NVS3B26_21420 [Mycobacteriales bacterium]
MPDRDDRSAAGRPSLSLSTLAGLGLANAVSLVVGLVVGHYLDDRYGTAPVFVLVGLALGLTLGVVGSFLEIRRYLQD